MASLPPNRRTKSSPWPGYFSSNPAVRARAELDQVDPDAAPIDRLRDLNNLRAVQAVMDDLGHDFAPHHLLDEGLLGDAGFGPTGRPKRPYGATDPAGDAFSFDSGVDGYLTSTPGQDRDDPGDMRDSFSVDMAKEGDPDEESDPEKYFSPGGAGAEVGSGYSSISEEEYWRHSSQSSLGMATYFTYQALDEMQRGGDAADAAVRAAQLWLARYEYAQRKLEEVQRKKKRGDDKPRPDSDGSHRPTKRELLDLRRLFDDLMQWGDPATDHRLDRVARGRWTAEAEEQLRHFRQGGHPAVYDRLGNLEEQEYRGLSERALRRKARWENPAINWGPDGPAPTRYLAGHMASLSMQSKTIRAAPAAPLPPRPEGE